MLQSIFGAIALLCAVTFRSWRAVLCIVVPLTLVSIPCNAVMARLGIGLKVATNLFEDHKATQLMVGRSEKLGGDSLTALSTYFGPAVHITQMTGQSNGQPIHPVLLDCHVPIDMNSFELRYGVIVKKVAGLTDEQNLEIANAYVKEAQRVLYEDVDIWCCKTRIDNPLLCEGDGPLYQMRDGYSWFYLDVVDVRRDVRRARDIRNADSRRRRAAGAASRVRAAVKTGGPTENRGGIETGPVGRQHPPHKARASPVRTRRTERA